MGIASVHIHIVVSLGILLLIRMQHCNISLENRQHLHVYCTSLCRSIVIVYTVSVCSASYRIVRSLRRMQQLCVLQMHDMIVPYLFHYAATVHRIDYVAVCIAPM